VTLGGLIWVFIVRRRNKDNASTSSSTKSQFSSTAAVFLPQRPESVHYANQIPSPKLSPPPAYSPGLMTSSSASNKKSTPVLDLDVNCDAEATLPSPIRSASFNPSAKTQSLGSRISSRMSLGAKKLYVHPSGWYSAWPKLELT
jgi:hypothetical protein